MLLVDDLEAPKLSANPRLRELGRSDNGALFEVREPMISNR